MGITNDSNPDSKHIPNKESTNKKSKSYGATLNCCLSIIFAFTIAIMIPVEIRDNIKLIKEMTNTSEEKIVPVSTAFAPKERIIPISYIRFVMVMLI